jgi:hypothetical protein
MDVKQVSGAEVTLSEKGERTHTRTFRVITDSPLVTATEVLLAAGIPRRGDWLPSDTAAYVKTVTPRQDEDNPLLWEVRVVYDTSVEPDQEENPIARPVEIVWGASQWQRLAEKDIDGNALLNSAGYYFDPPPEADDSRPVLTITRNEAAFNPTLAIDYQDAVNSNNFLGFDPDQVKVASITAARQFENGVYFWRVTYEFNFRREGWTLKILDQGRYRLNRKPIREKNAAGVELDGTHVADPVPLDGLGEPLANPTPATVKYRNFKIYKERDFSVFNF